MALFKEMTDAGLREAYWSERALAANWDNMTKGARNPKLLRRASSGVLRSLRNIDIIVAIARKRGVSLTRPAGGKKKHGVAVTGTHKSHGKVVRSGAMSPKRAASFKKYLENRGYSVETNDTAKLAAEVKGMLK